MNKTVIAVLLLSLLAFSEVYAKEEKNGNGRHLTGNAPSYFVHAFDDESHEEFYISIKNPLFSRSLAWMDRYFSGKKIIYFAYNGKFDFFLNSRFSAPVISRGQNPGLFFENEYEGRDGFSIKSLRLGWYHESNGQHIETQETFLITENAEDFVSRGWDYLGLDFKFSNNRENAFDLYLRGRVFCDCQGFGLIEGKEDQIFWKTVTEQPDVRDFNGLSTIFNYAYADYIRVFSIFRFGTARLEALENISYKVGATLGSYFDIPLTVFYFKGYGKEIAFYHEKGEYWGLGLELW